MMPESQAPSLLYAEDSGLCPLPFYPVLGESSGHGGGLVSELLSSPCWRLRWVYPENEVLPRAQSTLEPRATVGLWPGTQKNPEASAGEMDPNAECQQLCFFTSFFQVNIYYCKQFLHPSKFLKNRTQLCLLANPGESLFAGENSIFLLARSKKHRT